MKKTALYVLLLLCACSCTKSVDISWPDMNFFKESMLERTLFCPVTTISELEMKVGSAILAPGYHTEIISADRSRVTIDRTPERDSTWTVTGSAGKMTFGTTVIMTGRNTDGLCEWSATGSGAYDENNGYTATIDFASPAVFYWEKTLSSSTLSYALKASGDYILKTFRNGAAIESLNDSFINKAVNW